jgi:hypothetical protein
MVLVLGLDPVALIAMMNRLPTAVNAVILVPFRSYVMNSDCTSIAGSGTVDLNQGGMINRSNNLRDLGKGYRDMYI